MKYLICRLIGHVIVGRHERGYILEDEKTFKKFETYCCSRCKRDYKLGLQENPWFKENKILTQ